MNPSLNIVILAAGQSKRMKTNLPKVLHLLGGKPLLQHVVETAKKITPNIYVVHGNSGDKVIEQLKNFDIHWVEQKEQLGTGHAVNQALSQISEKDRVLVLFGDVPLISEKTLQRLIQQTPADAVGLIVIEKQNPTGYGRIIRDANGKILSIIEEKDASKQQRKLKETNSGFILAPAKNLKKWLANLTNKNAQGEYYLTDIIAAAVADNCPVIGIPAESENETQGINDRIELAKQERYFQLQNAQNLMRQGVTLMDPNRFDVRGDLIAEKDIIIDVNVVIEGKVSIGSSSKIGPNVFIKNSKIGKNVEIKANSFIDDSTIDDNCIIGPFSRLRPETNLHKNVHVGNFVEIKKSELGEESKAMHLAYIGDTIIGKKVNVGAGVITCNYDGVNKNQTIIKDGAFIGSDSQLVAPVTIGENAYIGSGSTINKDAPANKLTLARAKQTTVENWRPPKKSEKK